MLKLKILKAVVLILTFLLIFGINVLASRLSGGLKKKTAARPASVTLGEPEGSEIGAVATAGNNLYIPVKGGGRPDRVIIFDTETYRPISTININ